MRDLPGPGPLEGEQRNSFAYGSPTTFERTPLVNSQPRIDFPFFLFLLRSPFSDNRSATNQRQSLADGAGPGAAEWLLPID